MRVPADVRVWNLGQHVAKGNKAADPAHYLKPPSHLWPYNRIMPTLAHGSKITFATQITDKSYSRVRKAFYPNIVFVPLYSRALQMTVQTRASTRALKVIDERGGFDEYLLTAPDKYLCDIGRMYQKLVRASSNAPHLIEAKNDLTAKVNQFYSSPAKPSNASTRQ